MRRSTTALALALSLGFVACEADRETFEAGGTLETPPAVEQAPAIPFPSTPETTEGLSEAGTPPPASADSADGAAAAPGSTPTTGATQPAQPY